MTTRHRWRRRALAAGALFSLLTATVPAAPAQSLGEVARREAERRAQVKAGRAYTNADLAPGDASEPAPAPSPVPGPVETVTKAGTAAPATPAPGEEAEPANDPGVEPIIVKAREKRDERYWRATTQDLRRRLAKVTADAAVRSARIREIDEGPRTPTTVREREVIAASLNRLVRDARAHSEELTRFLARARIAKIPEEWIR